MIAWGSVGIATRRYAMYLWAASQVSAGRKKNRRPFRNADLTNFMIAVAQVKEGEGTAMLRGLVAEAASGTAAKTASA